MKLLIICLGLTIPTIIYGQVDHIKGAHALELSGGIGHKTGLYKIGYYYFFSDKFFIEGDFFHVMTRPGEAEGYDLARYGFDIAQNYRMYTYKGILFLNVFLGITSAWNTIKVDDGDFGYKDTIKFGFMVGSELEVRLYKKLMGVLAGDGRYMLNKNFGNWRVYGTIGIRYTL